MSDCPLGHGSPREHTAGGGECVACRRERQRTPHFNLVKRKYRRRLADITDWAQIERLLHEQAN